MPIFRPFMRRAYIAVAEMTWTTLLGLWLAHMILSWIALSLAGEDALTAPVDFLYYYATTATTVGYGDLSPSTQAGRIAGFAFVLPGSIAVFTAVLGRGIADLGTFWRRGMNGLGDYASREGHTLVVGWQEPRTRRLVRLLLGDEANAARMVLMCKSLDQNPMPDRLDFVRADSLSNPVALSRAGAQGADVIVVRGQDDDETLAATLAASAAAPDTHIVAHFEDDRAADLIMAQCPRVEAIGSLSAELLVRSARDAGASRMADRLFSADSDDTAYSIMLPEGAGGLTYLEALVGLKRSHDVTLLGVGTGQAIDLNCPPERSIVPGETLFYIADARLEASAIDWKALDRRVGA